MNSRIRQFARAIACCLLLSLGTNALANAAEMLGHVLCLGDDGHVAVEQVTGRDCDTARKHETHSGAHTQSGAQATQDTHCGGCTDIALSATAAVSNPQVAKAFDRTPHDEPALTPATVLHLATRTVSHQPPLLVAFELPNPTLIERRTVVLII